MAKRGRPGVSRSVAAAAGALAPIAIQAAAPVAAQAIPQTYIYCDKVVAPSHRCAADSNPKPPAIVGWNMQLNEAEYFGATNINACAILDVYDHAGSSVTSYKKCGPTGGSGGGHAFVYLEAPKFWPQPYVTVASVYNGSDYAHTLHGNTFGESY